MEAAVVVVTSVGTVEMEMVCPFRDGMQHGIDNTYYVIGYSSFLWCYEVSCMR